MSEWATTSDDSVCRLHQQRTQASAADIKLDVLYSSPLRAVGPRLLNCCCANCRWYAEPQLPARGARLLPPPPQRTLQLRRLPAARPPRPSCRGAQILAARAGPAAACMGL